MYACECSSHAIPELDGSAPAIGGRYRIGNRYCEAAHLRRQMPLSSTFTYKISLVHLTIKTVLIGSQ
jgi:hypothetical protein